jgi:signal peptidase II
MNNFLKNLTLKNIAIALVIAIFFIVDRYLKILAVNMVATAPIKLIGNIFSFHFTVNYYIAFSIPLSGWIISALIVLIIAILIYYIFYLTVNKKARRGEILLLTIIILGAISNVLDRFSYGYVVDYLELKYFTVFNLADIMISGGAIILIFKNITSKRYA